MGLPRVLLVDDDATMRRFVALALEDHELDLLMASSAAEALALLRETGPVQLVLTDLMMPGISGIGLLRSLTAAPALRGSAHLAVLSAGLTPEARTELEALGVWRCLRKPVPLAELEACVRDATRAGADAAALSGSARSSEPSASEDGVAQAEEAAIAQHFGGQRELHAQYRAACLEQFADDITEGAAAAASADGAALRRLGHNLKTVLATLGCQAGAATAWRLEQAAASGDASAPRLWDALRRELEALRGGIGR